MADLDALFYPRSVAVIGASNRPLTIGHRILANLLANGFRGAVYPVNPTVDSILDLPAFPSISVVPGEVDVAHIVVRNALVRAELEACGEKGVKVAIINASGFRESGPEGAALELELVALGRRLGVRLFGPNCQGVMNTDQRVSLYSNFTFAEMRPGHISMVCQGGGVAELINNTFGMRGVGQRMYASNGNACDISIPEIIEYYGADEETHVIVLHLESLADPAEFLARVRPVAARKPILALKSGTTVEGARAVASHTGGLMSDDTLTEVLFDACGVLRFTSLAELCEAAEAFASQPIPRGKRIGIVTNAGSPAIIVTDDAIHGGLEVPDLDPASKALLAEKLQGIASVANPIDMMATASGPEFAASLEALLGDPNVDAVVVCFVTPFFVDTTRIAEAIATCAASAEKPLVAVALTNPERNEEWRATVERVRRAGVPVYAFPGSAARALVHMDRFRRLRGRPCAPPPELAVDRDAACAAVAAAPPSADGFLAPDQVTAVLRAYGIPLVCQARGGTWEEVRSAALAVGFPVVLKAEAPALVHKTEVGAVVLGLADEGALAEAYHALVQRLADRPGLGFAVQRHLAGGVEVIVGGARRPGLGPVVMFGLGGVHVELFKDVVFRLAPLSTSAAERMLGEIKAAPLLADFRGRPPIDTAPLVEILLRVSRLMADHEEIAELDLNPIVAFPEGERTAVVDARIRVRAAD